jgi:hypothetical protein
MLALVLTFGLTLVGCDLFNNEDDVVDDTLGNIAIAKIELPVLWRSLNTNDLIGLTTGYTLVVTKDGADVYNSSFPASQTVIQVELTPGNHTFTLNAMKDNEVLGSGSATVTLVKGNNNVNIVLIPTGIEESDESTYANITVTWEDKNTVILNGTVFVMVTGDISDMYSTTVNAYTDSYSGTLLGSSNVDLVTGEWSISIPSFENATDVYFSVEARTGYGIYLKNVSNRSVKHDDMAINMGNISISAIAVYGTTIVTANGRPIESVIRAFLDYECTIPIGYGCWVYPYDNTWQILMQEYDEPTTIYFQTELSCENSIEQKALAGNSIIYNTNTNIDLGTVNIDTIVLFGTVDVENPALYGVGEVMVYLDDTYTSFYNYALFNVRNNRCEWTMAFTEINRPQTLYFKIQMWDMSSSGYITKDIEGRIISGDENSIDIGTFSFP